jgi:intracellular multiplication protein IcmO
MKKDPLIEITESLLGIGVKGLTHLFKDKSDQRVRLSSLNTLRKMPHPTGQIGQDFKGSDIILNENARCQHMLVLGATGLGKTTLMINLIIESIKKGEPVIIIDPKGSDSDVNLIKGYFLKYSSQNSKFYQFKLNSPEESHTYNPLRHGTPEQIKAKLLDALAINHEYYLGVASDILGTLIQALHYLGDTITLQKLSDLVSEEIHISSLQERFKNQKNMDEKIIFSRLISITKYKRTDYLGLLSQLHTLNPLELKSILSPTEPDIDLLEIMKTGSIAYFRLNQNSYSDISSRIGKVILQDLRSVSNMIQISPRLRSHKFCAVFVDEFGSFATPTFSDFLKMTRDAGIGVTMLTQVLSDLKAVSQEFLDQIIGNTVFKFIFRCDVPNDLQIISGIIGTIDTQIESHQTQQGFGHKVQTGLGNTHEGKSYRVEPDVIRNLGIGECILIDKDKKTVSLLKITNSKIPLEAKESTPNPLAKREKQTSVKVFKHGRI